MISLQYETTGTVWQHIHTLICQIRHEHKTDILNDYNLSFPGPLCTQLKLTGPTIRNSSIQIWINKHIKNWTTTRYIKVILKRNKSKTPTRWYIFTYLGHNNAQVNYPKRTTCQKNEANVLAKIGNNKPLKN